MNAGAVPIDFASDLGKVRLLIGDTDATGILNGEGSYAFYGDAELAALLLMYPDPRRAAVSALRTFAAAPAVKLKVWTEGGLQVDGAKVTTALIDLAESIERGIALSDAADGFTISEPVGGEERGMYYPDMLLALDLSPNRARRPFFVPLANRLGVV